MRQNGNDPEVYTPQTFKSYLMSLQLNELYVQCQGEKTKTCASEKVSGVLKKEETSHILWKDHE